MKIMHEQLEMTTGTPLKVKWCDYDHFKYPWHFHGEYEIVYILKSIGSRFVGNSIEAFGPQDLTLLGSYLPHMYRNDDIYYHKNPKLRVHAVTVQFSKNMFEEAIDSYPEFFKIKTLLADAKHGIHFSNNAENKEIRKRILSMVNMDGLSKLLECLKILSLMASSNSKRLLSEDFNANNEPGNVEDNRLMNVLAYLNREYVNDIKLQSVAQIAYMNESAFCRFFKNNTGKSLMEYLTELRIGCACKLLLKGNLSVSQICYESGFNNIANFNRHFKKITNFSPKEYIAKFKKEEENYSF